MLFYFIFPAILQSKFKIAALFDFLSQMFCIFPYFCFIFFKFLKHNIFYIPNFTFFSLIRIFWQNVTYCIINYVNLDILYINFNVKDSFQNTVKNMEGAYIKLINRCLAIF